MFRTRGQLLRKGMFGTRGSACAGSDRVPGLSRGYFSPRVRPAAEPPAFAVLPVALLAAAAFAPRRVLRPARAGVFALACGPRALPACPAAGGATEGATEGATGAPGAPGATRGPASPRPTAAFFFAARLPRAP